MEENVSFLIAENRSTSSSKYIVRRRTVLHKSSKEEKGSSEVFEESFTIPLHKFNLSLILSQSKIENVEDTVVVSRTVVRAKSDSSKSETEEIDLTSESASRDLDSILPMIDFTEISNIQIVERRRQIVRRKVSECWSNCSLNGGLQGGGRIEAGETEGPELESIKVGHSLSHTCLTHWKERESMLAAVFPGST